MQKLFIPDEEFRRYECGNCHKDITYAVKILRIKERIHCELPPIEKIIYKFDPPICPKCKSKFIGCQQVVRINRFTYKLILECEQMKGE